MKRIMLPAMTLAVLVGFSDQSMDAGGGIFPYPQTDLLMVDDACDLRSVR
jgi:hypothetical protein